MLQVFGVGNVGRVEPLKAVGETHVLNFSVAHNEYRKGETTTAWFRLALWGAFAEKMAQYIEVGKTVAWTGSLIFDPETGSPRVYEGKNGAGASYEATVQNLNLVGKKSDTASDDAPF